MLKNLALCAALAVAPVSASAAKIDMDTAAFGVEGASHRFEVHAGKKSLYLENGEANVKGVTFENGVIEYDILFPNQRGFIGVQFRKQGDGLNYEDFYVRSHQANNPDANQYTPVFNGIPGWQIYYGLPYSTPVPYKFGEWNHVKLVVQGDRADVYINSEEPTLHIADLKHQQRAGGVGLWCNLTGAWFAGLSVTSSDDVAIVAKPAADREVPSGTVTQWSVSDPMAPAALGDGLSADVTKRLAWTALQTETNGIANLARAAQISQEKNVVLARIAVDSERKQTKRLRFGFSDAVKVYVNGALVFDGDESYQSRDYRHLGTVGLYDAIYASLKKGRNEIVFAVEEGFGGWAVAGAFDDFSGISLEQTAASGR